MQPWLQQRSRRELGGTTVVLALWLEMSLLRLGLSQNVVFAVVGEGFGIEVVFGVIAERGLVLVHVQDSAGDIAIGRYVEYVRSGGGALGGKRLV
jgi:hypothetical protein